MFNLRSACELFVSKKYKNMFFLFYINEINNDYAVHKIFLISINDSLKKSLKKIEHIINLNDFFYYESTNIFLIFLLYNSLHE